MRIVDSARLWFREGKSDKVYEVDLVEVATDQYVVNFRYGRRGSALRDGTKTPVPVPLDKARALYAALIAEKVKGGYQGVEGGDTDAAPAPRPVAASESKRASREAKTNAWLLAALAKGLRSEEPIHRVIRKVGERGLREAEPLLLELLAAGKPPQGMKPAVFGHVLVAALARCGSTASIGHLQEIVEGKIYPRHLRCMARLALVMIGAPGQRERARASLPAALVPGTTADAANQAQTLEALIASKPGEGHAATFALYLLAATSTGASDAEALAARRLVLSAARVVRLSGEGLGVARTLTWAAELRRDGELFALLARRFETGGGRYDATLNYFRRRAGRVLRRLGRLGSPDYVPMASALLLAYRDDDAQPVIVSSHWSEDAGATKEARWDAFARYHALNLVLYGHSPRYEKAGHQRATWRCKARYRPGAPAPSKREESFPELWDRAPEALWRIASSAAATPVIQFATRALRDHQAVLDALSDQALAAAMATMHPLTRQLAFETARKRPPSAALAKGALAAGIDEADQWVLAWIGSQPAVLAADAELVVALVMSPSALVREAGARHARAQHFADALARDIVLRTIAALLALRVEPLAEERAQSAAAFLLEALPQPLAALGEKVLHDLLDHPLSAVRSLGARIVAQTPVAVMKDAPDLLAHFALSANAELREGTRALLGEVARLHPDVGQAVAAHLLAALREAQPQGAPAHVVSLMRKELANCLPRADANMVLGLLGALSPHAREAGGLLLGRLGPDELSLQEIVKLASHELLSVRRGAWELASKARERFAMSPVALARLCDAKWEDSRVFAFELVQSFAPDVLVPDVVIAICDSVLSDVQRFGQGLMQAHWDDRHASRYLLRLAEHPSTSIQLLVSGLLDRHAHGNLEMLRELVPYFATVLSQVNRGAVAKQRVLAFLRAEATSSAEAASLLGPLLDRQSATSAVTHKAPLIATMVELHDRHPDVPLPIAVHVPPIHARSARGV